MDPSRPTFAAHSSLHSVNPASVRACSAQRKCWCSLLRAARTRSYPAGPPKPAFVIHWQSKPELLRSARNLRHNGQLVAWLLLVPMCADVQITLRRGPSIWWTLS
jgi:hypothetical protein